MKSYTSKDLIKNAMKFNQNNLIVNVKNTINVRNMQLIYYQKLVHI